MKMPVVAIKFFSQKQPLDSRDYTPVQATSGSAGFDIYSMQDATIYPGAREAISTGLYVEVPEGYVLKLYPRSGLALRGLTLANCVGIIDSDYRGEVKAIILNTSNEIKHITKGDRIIQAMLERVVPTEWLFSRELNPTSRGSGGFGSTGV
jgi:dUTP pyrophosphatase